MNDTQQQFLNKYLQTLAIEKRPNPENILVEHFCADELNANICSNLILSGEKTATCGIESWYEQGLVPRLKVGDLQVVTDWNGTPTSIIEFIEISRCKFSDVTEEFAALEGEGDKSLEWWRKEHWRYFSNESKKLGTSFSDDTVLTLEKFKLVFPNFTA